LFDTGEISRLGTVNDGTTTMDYDADETKRHIASMPPDYERGIGRHHTPGKSLCRRYPQCPRETRYFTAAPNYVAQTERVWQWVSNLVCRASCL
jgi:hypothetical protein